MVKISRPILYAAVAGVVLYAVVLLTEPEAPARRVTNRTRTATTATTDGFTAQDRSATYPRYNGAQRDAFRPQVAPSRKGSTTGYAPPTVPPMPVLPPGGGFSNPGERGSWTLTGINVLNGVRSALVENAATGDHRFLRAGEMWNGLRVARITEDAVILENALGQQTRLTFPQPEEPRAPGAPATPAAPRPGG